MRLENSLISCGVKQLFELHEYYDEYFEDELDGESYYRTPVTNTKRLTKLLESELRRAFLDVIEHRNKWADRQIIFSDRVTWNGQQPNSGGEFLAAFITKRHFGYLDAGPIFLNPNTGRYIKTWIWTPNMAFKEFIFPPPKPKKAPAIKKKVATKNKLKAQSKTRSKR